MKGLAGLGLGILSDALRHRRRQVAAVAAWSAVQAVPTLVFGRAIAGATDAFLGRRVGVGFGWLAVLVLAAGVGAVGSQQVFRAMAGIVEPLRDDLVCRVVEGALRRSTRHGAQPDTGAAARITSQVEIVRDSFAGMVTIVGRFVFTAGGALVGLVTLAPIGAALVVPPLAGAIVVFFAMLRPSARRQRAAILADEAVAEAASTMVRGLRDIVACGANDEVRAKVDAEVDAQARAARALALLGSTRTLVLALGAWLPLVAILVLTPWLLRRGVTAGTLLGMLAYVRGGVLPALHSFVQGVGGSGVRLAVMLERIREVSDDPQLTDKTTGGARPHGHALELRSVTFAYSYRAEPVIHDLDFDIPEGDHLAIIGPSGIGKSTLAGLMTGVLRPLSGEVRFGNVRLGATDSAALARWRVLIPQEAYIFAGTLAENLSYFVHGAPREALDAAVDAVGLRPLLDRLGGYQAQVHPETLSAGERQLIALTRAYLSPARLAVLDEATCHLDPAAEARAERAFACRPGTLIVVAHRVSSALRARRVLVLDGAHALIGTHEILLAASPMYRDLVGHWWSAEVPVSVVQEARRVLPGGGRLGGRAAAAGAR